MNFYNNYQSNNYMGGVQQALTPEAILREINLAVSAVYYGQTSDPFYAIKVIDKFIESGDIIKVGGGSNRIAIKFNNMKHNDMQLRNASGMANFPNVVYMVPAFKIVDGLKDNKREEGVFNFVFNMPLNGDPHITVLKERTLPSRMIPNSNILMQKQVTRIEDSVPVQQLIKTGQYTPNQIADACRDTILENPTVYSQYFKLMKAMDTYFVMADLNPEFSSFNFGFDERNNLVILDYGYVVPKDPRRPLVCPHCGMPYYYLIPGEDFLENSTPQDRSIIQGIRSEVSRFGQYCCKNMNCRTTVGPSVEKDIDVFLRYTSGY